MRKGNANGNGNIAKRTGVKILILCLSLLLVAAGAVGGTLAWLISKTSPVVNTFTYGDINITLKETDPEGNDDPTDNSYIMVPGHTISKDPLVTVLAGSEACWLFVKVDESANLGDFIEYTVAEGWIALDETDYAGVYYREVDAVTEDTEFGVLAGDQVTVLENVTKEMLNNLTADTYPTLTFTAYAVQRDGEVEAIDTAAKAWAIAVAESE
ncbi:MAG: hypothetical protein IJX47_00785 [Clostridia bacterium]|nr:hypothetical protein [Clostridia bacterium]